MKELLRFFIDNLKLLWPFTIVKAWEQGVLVQWGVVKKLCTSSNGIGGTGLHWCWPIIAEVYTQECNLDPFETPPQTVDGQTITLGAQPRIVDLAAYFVTVRDDLKVTVGDVLRMVAAERASEGAVHTETFGEEVRVRALERMKGWGVELEWVSLITFANSPVLRLILDKGQGEAPTFNLSP